MADKKTPMGDDPLAWLANGDESPAAKKPPAKRTRVRRSTKAAKAKTETELLEESFAALAPQGEQLATRFYERLFDKYPETAPLFEDIPIKGQEKKLLASLVLLVQNLHKPEVLAEYLQGLGARHVHYGVTTEDYPKVAENLLAVMAELAGNLWTEEVKTAWEKTLNTVATIMLQAYQSTEEADMAMTQKQAAEMQQELARMGSAVNGSATAMMMINRDFEITFVNQATITMLRPYESILTEVFPGFDLDNLLGTNIDRFHKDPAHQRKLLADPANLPYSTDIVVGPLTFRLNVSAMVDGNDYIGCSLEWANVTDERASETEVARLSGTVEGARTSIMMIDRDFFVTYANQSTIDMLTEYQDVLKQVFPRFNVKDLIGANIDQFHKDPSHQRKLLADPANLPYNTDIEVGPLSFNLNVTAILNADGDYIGTALEWANNTEQKNTIAEYEGQLTAISKAMGVISFNMDGIILDVNEAFLGVVGYSKEEVVGKHHRMFAEPSLANSPEYTEFWAKLNRGEFDAGEYKRIGKAGNEIWLQASYNPILDINDQPVKVIKYATDVTSFKLASADSQGQLNAIDKAMGVISFNMDGTIQSVNDNFLDVVGYSREEIVGQHHRMFAAPEVANSPEYREFWAKLNRGEFDAGEYQRVTKDGSKVWLQASYNPIMDLNGKPFKVVKYASDITAQKDLQATVQNALQSTSMVMNAMSEGDLTQKFEGTYDGEFALLQSAINDTVEKISSIVTEINETAVSIGTAATEITRGNVDLSQRTEEQASSLEETASSMEELTSTVRQNSDNAAQANQLASTAREQAEKGGSVIREAINAMSAISSSSKKVTDIIGVIDEIAFQTNLLALNAAVEAARAGEQGRGFAVVASEVRNLAQRSAAAAKEIKELINDSGEKVKEGSMLVDESGRTLEDIVTGAKKVGDIISEIAAAGQEQTSGIGQVNTAIGQMDEMTQQNAALVEEAAAASESMDEQGKGLQRLMSFFDTGVDSDLTVEPSAPAAAKPAPAPKAAATKRAKPTPPAASHDDEWDEF